jgi:oxygen-independent coproporphyrinogen-3 oxidase
VDDLPQLTELITNELASHESERLQLTPAGLELSDAIGPWLYSPHVNRLMEECECH